MNYEIKREYSKFNRNLFISELILILLVINQKVTLYSIAVYETIINKIIIFKNIKSNPTSNLLKNTTF